MSNEITSRIEEDKPLVPTNSLQTPIVDDLLKAYPQEVGERLLETVATVPFVKNLISPNRRRAKEMPHDSLGRVVIDFADPHILEDMDYFRPSAIHYEKNGCYTKLKVNGNPNSEYGRWIREERRRCWEGYVRESDGEWVTGYMYWYLNYCPIMLTKVGKDGVANRVEGFPRVWDGVYLRFHYLERARMHGKHGIELARRGCGKSFSLAAIMSHNFVLGRNAVAHKRCMTIITAYQNEYLSGKDGTLSKFVPMIDFVARATQFPRRRLINSQQKMQWMMGYKDMDTGTDKGSLNQVIGVSSKDDEAKLRGKRGDILIEEMGSFPKLLSIFNTIRYGVEEGDMAFGFIYLVGTANEDASDFSSAKTLLYSPKAHNIYEVPNVYDKVNNGKPTFGFFFPSYLSRLGCMDDDGNSDVVKALLQILMKRDEAKYASDPSTLMRTIAEMPITPAEAIVKADSNLFPVAQLTERLGQIESNASFFDDVTVGTLDFKGNELTLRPTSAKPIRDFPHDDNKMEGAIEFYEQPAKDADGKIQANRYIAGLDPYDDDASHTTSLGSLFVLDLMTDRIVCEYTGRPKFADEMYEIVRKVCLWYNAKLNYENNKKGLFAYFSRMHCVHLLTETLEILRDKQLVKETGYGNKACGTNATLPVNQYARARLREWLLSPVEVPSPDNDGSTVSISKLYTIRNKALIQELITWNREGNFDRVSAMGMLMLLREDRLAKCGGEVGKLSSTAKGQFDDDKFFKKYDEIVSARKPRMFQKW